ncbi:MAG: hypothetical protein E7289_07345 [Lachnospiraceae bacterium]|nr:hypothetical protein [Lachnospiraceae bacterium]
MELIIFIIIISAILKSSKKKKASSKPNVQRPQQTRPQQARPQQARPQQARPQQPTPIPGRSAQNKPVPSRSGEKEEMSTTQMLEAKALADDRQEMIEKQKQRMENKKHYGHHNYAEKYILGDMVPKGKKMVYCSYCNAENLIPTYSSARDYNCYFCREKL